MHAAVAVVVNVDLIFTYIKNYLWNFLLVKMNANDAWRPSWHRLSFYHVTDMQSLDLCQIRGTQIYWPDMVAIIVSDPTDALVWWSKRWCYSLFKACKWWFINCRLVVFSSYEGYHLLDCFALLTSCFSGLWTLLWHNVFGCHGGL